MYVYLAFSSLTSQSILDKPQRVIAWQCPRDMIDHVLYRNIEKRQTSSEEERSLDIFDKLWAFYPYLHRHGFKSKTIHLSAGFLLGLCYKWKCKKDGGDLWAQEGRFLSESYQLGSNYHLCCCSWFKRCVVHWFFSFTCKRFNQCFVSQVIYVLFLQGIWLMLFLDMIALLNML